MIEEGTTLPFRLYDFLAYLFPGAATMHAIYIMRRDDVSQLAQSMLTGQVLVDIMLGFIAAYLIGLIWSVITWLGVRMLVWRFCNPRIDYYSESEAAKSPLGVVLNKRLRGKVQEIFGPDIVDARQAHRLCRVFVTNHCAGSWERRASIVGVRAMCANCIGPVLLYGVAFARNDWWTLSIIAAVGCTALTFKMITLDQREWKEIYFAFLVGTTVQRSIEPTRIAGGDDV
ncbi:MAG: hypothetical protein EXS05_09625 [Planctomycetaceae bacterium]|nr:hypothetical protein [Planctomycetaceae bacterium]